MAQVVAIQKIDMSAARMQLLFNPVGDGGFARARQPGEPQAARRLAKARGARGLVHVHRLPMDIAGAPQGEIDRASGGGGMGFSINQDEIGQLALLLLGRERQRRVRGEVADRDFVELQFPRGDAGLRVYIDAMADLGHRGVDGTGAELQPVAAAGQQRRIVHPQQVHAELVGDFARLLRGDDHIAPAGVEVAVERQGNRLPGDGDIEISFSSDDAIDLRAPARRQHDDLVARTHLARCQRARQAAKILVRPVHPLHGKAQWRRQRGVWQGQRFKQRQQGRTRVPGHVRGRCRQVVAIARADRHRLHAGQPQFFGQGAIGGGDAVEYRLVVIDQIHLVDREHNMAHAHQRQDPAVPSRLREQPLARIDQHDGSIGGRSTGRHVARVLRMAGAVGDNELAPVGAEIAVGNIDGDALLALGGQAIQQQGEIEFFTGIAVPAAVPLQGGQLVVEQAF